MSMGLPWVGVGHEHFRKTKGNRQNIDKIERVQRTEALEAA